MPGGELMKMKKTVLLLVLGAAILASMTWLGGCALFTQTAQVAVDVSDALTGGPIAGATIMLGGDSGTTAANGVCWFLDATVGSLVVNVSAVGYEPYSETVNVEADVSQTIYVELVPAATGHVSGLVTCHCGRALPGVAIYMDGEQVATTDADGLYAFDAPAGYHTFTAGTPDATGGASHSMVIDEGETYEVNLVS
jgi:hypothetical protein